MLSSLGQDAGENCQTSVCGNRNSNRQNLLCMHSNENLSCRWDMLSHLIWKTDCKTVWWQITWRERSTRWRPLVKKKNIASLLSLKLKHVRRYRIRMKMKKKKKVRDQSIVMEPEILRLVWNRKIQITLFLRSVTYRYMLCHHKLYNLPILKHPVQIRNLVW